MTKEKSTPHIVLVGTGLSSLTAAHTLLTHPVSTSFHLTIIDKARLPGGRLTSRTYPNGTTLEPGARVFQSNSTAFHDAAETWKTKGWVKAVDHSRLKGVEGKGAGERWWEGGERGWSGSLIPGLAKEIQEAGAGRVAFHYNTTVQPLEDGMSLRTEPQVELPSVDVLVITSPTPQTTALLPSFTTAIKPTTYLASFALLYPTITLPATHPMYSRNPHASISAISTGISPNSDTPSGLIIQASPQQLSLTYDRESTSDDQIRSAFHDILEKAGLISESVIAEMESVGEEGWQVKRWKFAQVEKPPGERSDGEIAVVKKGVLIVAGDGESQRGGVEGAWYSGKAVAESIIKRLS